MVRSSANHFQYDIVEVVEIEVLHRDEDTVYIQLKCFSFVQGVVRGARRFVHARKRMRANDDHVFLVRKDAMLRAVDTHAGDWPRENYSSSVIIHNLLEDHEKELCWQVAAEWMLLDSSSGGAGCVDVCSLNEVERLSEVEGCHLHWRQRIWSKSRRVQDADCCATVRSRRSLCDVELICEIFTRVLECCINLALARVVSTFTFVVV